MPSITIRFDWDGQPSALDQRRTLLELSSHLQRRTIEAFAEGGEDLMGYDGALVDELTVDAIIDDGHGIIAADRADAAADDEHEARTRSRADEAPVFGE